MTDDDSPQPGQVDILTALRLLLAGASDEARPILKTAIEEIKRLRQCLASESE